MLDLQNEKKIILEFLNEIDNSDEKKILEILTKYTSNNFKMRCTHPFNELEGVDQIANRLWLPIKKSFKMDLLVKNNCRFFNFLVITRLHEVEFG